MMELWDLYDMHREKKGQHCRGDALSGDNYHLAVNVCIFSGDAKMLIARRQLTKSWAGMWDYSCGGSALIGENAQEAAHRELFEELGISYDFTGISPRLTLYAGNCLNDVFVISAEPDLADLVLQPEEVMDAKWATAEEIIAMVNDDKFIPYSEDYVRLLFFMRTHDGARLRTTEEV